MHIHPDLSTATETFFFAKDYHKGIEYYQQLMPNTTDDVITYEKTPSYYRLPVVPDRIRNFNSTIKLIMVTCDPVRRTLSDFYHQRRYTDRFGPRFGPPGNCPEKNSFIFFRLDPNPVQPGDFEEKFGPALTKMEKKLKEFITQGDDWFEQVYRMYKARTEWFNYTDIETNLIING